MRGLQDKATPRYKASTQNCIAIKEPPYAERHVRWCERSENNSRRKTTYVIFLLLDLGRWSRNYFSGISSSVLTRNCQNLGTEGMCALSPGVWGERSVGPKLTMSRCGYLLRMMEHSSPAWQTCTVGSLPNRSQ